LITILYRENIGGVIIPVQVQSGQGTFVNPGFHGNGGVVIPIQGEAGTGVFKASKYGTGGVTIPKQVQAGTGTLINEIHGEGGVSIPIQTQTGSGTFTEQILDHFMIEAEGGGPIGNQQVDTAFNIRITALDAADNVVVNFTSTVDITSNGTLSQGAGTTAAFVAGILTPHSVKFSAEQSSVTITATKTADSEFGVSNPFNIFL